MKKRLLLGIGGLVASGGLAATTAFATAPLAGASSAHSRVEIGQHLHFLHGPGASDGTFIASGAIKDSGTVSSTASLSPLGKRADQRLTGSETFVGQLGRFTVEFTGIAGPIGTPHEAVRGTFHITSGTGAYSDVRGHGTFLIVVDFPSGQLIRTDTGSATGTGLS